MAAAGKEMIPSCVPVMDQIRNYGLKFQQGRLRVNIRKIVPV